jgi:hypothetical protein
MKSGRKKMAQRCMRAMRFGIYIEGQVSDVKHCLAYECFSDWDYEWDDVVSVSAFDTVSAALSCLKRTPIFAFPRT